MSNDIHRANLSSASSSSSGESDSDSGSSSSSGSSSARGNSRPGSPINPANNSDPKLEVDDLSNHSDANLNIIDSRLTSDNSNSDKSDQSEQDQASDYESNKRSDVSNSERYSDSDREERESKYEKTDLKQLWEEFPDIYGVRRSARSRKEPERIGLKDGSDEDSNGSDKKRRNSGGDWRTQNSSDEGESSDFGASNKSVQRLARRPPPRKFGKKKPVLKNRRRNLSSESDDYSDAEERRETSRRSASKVSYKEQSADETDAEDVIEVDYDAAPVVEENVETIEKILEHRDGRRGAIGCTTTSYAVDENGDPNDNLLPDVEETELQYYIKWKNWSHIHNTWETEATLRDQKVKGLKKLENYKNREEEIRLWKSSATPEDIEYYECQEEAFSDIKNQHMQVDRIIAHAPPKPGTGSSSIYDFYCKWKGLPYIECTWEDGSLISKKHKDIIDEYFQRQKSQRIPSKVCRVLKIRPKFSTLKAQPRYIGGVNELELRDYQLHGVNWLVHSWCRENSVILADEMGLGKTIQTIGYISYLYNQFQLFGPYLIVVPLSTMNSWQREFSLWAPELNIIMYIGDVQSRNIIRDFEWCHPGNKRLKFNVLLTTYEILLKDKSFLGGISWAVLAIDEAHRLKNDDSLLYKSLYEFNTNNRLLITGTPLQNSLKELWSLLHFIMPNKFDDWDDFEHDHRDSADKGYSKLHRQLEPYILRRVKKDVEKSLPAKVEQILRVEMTAIQRQYYKWILTKNYKALTKGVKGSTTGFINIVMELKKCCNHSILTRPNEIINQDPLQQLIKGSGKLVLLDKLLCRLKETGHRVLVFSQMVRMLDILSEYMQYRHFQFQRLDGSIKGEIRKQALDHFNADGSQDFCFLLSTRAGGLGINLATADTVIIFDSDWNPQNDLQAQARAHRIGQKKQVNIYRLVTKGSVEEDIIERAKRKMVLDHLVIQRMDTTGRTVLSKGTKPSNNTNPFNKDELTSILKFGAEELFKEADNDDQDPQVDIDEILSRAETRDEQPTTVGDQLLSQFKVASFGAFDDDSMDPVATNDPKSWDDIIPENERKKIEDEVKQKEEMDMFLPPRNRRSVHVEDDGEESDWENSRSRRKKRDKNADSSLDDSDDDKPKRRGRPRSVNKDAVKGFTDSEIRRFIKSYKKFPRPFKRLESIASDAELLEKPMQDLKKLAKMLKNGCEEAMNDYKKAKEDEKVSTVSAENNDSEKKKRERGPSLKISGVNVGAKSVLSGEHELEPLDICIPSDPKERKNWALDIRCRDANFDVAWSLEEDSSLLKGIYEYGMGSWESIKMDPVFNLGNKILSDDDSKPQIKHLQSRVDYLLRLLRKQVDSQSSSLDKVKKSRKKAEKKAISKAIVDVDESNDGSATKNAVNLEIDSTIQSVIDFSLNPNATDESSMSVKTELNKEKKNKEKKKLKKEKVVAPPMHFTANALPVIVTGETTDLDPDIFNQCKEKMRPVKKSLRQLDKPEQELNEKEQLLHTKQCLIKIGDHISTVLREYSDPDTIKEWRGNLWFFVSKFTEYDHKKLYKIYKHAKQAQNSSSDLKPANEIPNDTKPTTDSAFTALKRKNDSEYSSSKRTRTDSKSSHRDYDIKRDRERDHSDRDRDRHSNHRKYDDRRGRDREDDRHHKDRHSSDRSKDRDRYNRPYQRSRDSDYHRHRNHSDRRDHSSDRSNYHHNSSQHHNSSHQSPWATGYPPSSYSQHSSTKTHASLPSGPPVSSGSATLSPSATSPGSYTRNNADPRHRNHDKRPDNHGDYKH